MTPSDRNGRVLAWEPFWASDHLEAQETGSLVLEACKDVACEYEVWGERSLIARGCRRRGLFTLQGVIDARQTNVIDLEDRLAHGFTAIAQSRRLLRATETLRQKGLLTP